MPAIVGGRPLGPAFFATIFTAALVLTEVAVLFAGERIDCGPASAALVV